MSSASSGVNKSPEEIKQRWGPMSEGSQTSRIL